MLRLHMNEQLACSCSIEVEVDYYERDNLMLTKVDTAVIIAKDAPLLDTFMKSATLSEVNHITYYSMLAS